MEDLAEILQKITNKRKSYEQYNFTVEENDAFKTFFDLSQEYGSTEDFYKLCVAIPLMFFNLQARLFVINPKDNRLSLQASTVREQNVRVPEVRAGFMPYRTDEDSFVFIIRGNEQLLNQLPFKTTDGVLGIFEIFPAAGLTGHHELFFQKYANRIGFNIHNRFIIEKNIEHLRFIRTLVADIEHNVITPNMVYKLFLRNLKGKISSNHQLEQRLSEALRGRMPGREKMEDFLADLSDVNRGLNSELQNMERHYKNMSLFLETLLRRSHFDTGRLVLRTKKCNIKRDVLDSQLEQYRERFRRMGIEINDRMSGVPEEEVISVVDEGLIAQVYSNLFSNALKYTQPVALDSGQTRKYISYGRELVKDFFGPGRDGVKYNVFSTGPHISPAESRKIFDEGYRGRDTMDRPGTGHGLAFIKTVLEIHGGVVGYEATRFGNNFYFILPQSEAA